MRAALPLLLIVALLSGCAHKMATITGATVEVLPVSETSPAWRDVAHGEDVQRIASLPERYAAVLGTSRSDVLRADAGKGRPDPTPGAYDCRITRVGVRKAAVRTTAFRAFTCYVGDDGEFLTLTKSAGSERPGGRLWRDTEARMVFLGAVPLDGEGRPKAYGDDPSTDRIGLFERIGDFRWRLIFDAARPDAGFDVLELTPVAPAIIAAR